MKKCQKLTRTFLKIATLHRKYFMSQYTKRKRKIKRALYRVHTCNRIIIIFYIFSDRFDTDSPSEQDKRRSFGRSRKSRRDINTYMFYNITTYQIHFEKERIYIIL